MKADEPHQIAQRVGANIRRLREMRRWTVEHFAYLTGLSAVYVGLIERGRREPSLAAIEIIAEALSVPIGDLFGSREVMSEQAIHAAMLFKRAPSDGRAALLLVLLNQPQENKARPVHGKKPFRETDPEVVEFARLFETASDDLRCAVLILLMRLQPSGSAPRPPKPPEPPDECA